MVRLGPFGAQHSGLDPDQASSPQEPLTYQVDWAWCVRVIEREATTSQAPVVAERERGKFTDLTPSRRNERCPQAHTAGASGTGRGTGIILAGEPREGYPAYTRFERKGARTCGPRPRPPRSSRASERATKTPGGNSTRDTGA